MTPKPTAAIVADFDAIASALRGAPGADVLTASERALLTHLPRHARTALDVGCGHGVMSRALAARGLDVTGIDVSPGMIALARERGGSRITYHLADILQDTSLGAFDVVVCVNVVHHLPLRDIVPRIAGAVAPGGSLLLQDVVRRPGVRYAGVNTLAVARALMDRVLSATRAGSWVRRLYDEHGAGEEYLTPAEAEAAYAALLPHARVVHHLAWRYSVIWQRPARRD
jgi:2-polyprenyl-3-methyl-5-hydroxy-6-metoxy-1,4-benzoquinol methylase